ncbi:MAG: hypothetical protein ACI8ZB_002396 [Desulforhopalus sp.]
MGVAKKTLMDEIELYVQYAVEEKDLEMARGVINSYKDDERVLRLLLEYYTILPEAREEPVHKLSCLMEQGGVGLFVVVCTSYSYLYAVSVEEILLLTEYQEEVPLEVVSFFGYSSHTEFLKDCPSVEELVVYPGSQDAVVSVCPACGVTEGEEHLLGCIVEVCPWCAGTLNNCNCRFEQLKVEEIENEEQLETFSDLLSAMGRIPYAKEQKVAYPGTSKGLDGEEKNEN